MQPKPFHAGARIFTTGDPSDAVYIIESGSVSITVGAGPQRTEVARLGPGELFGESGVLEKRARSASAIAVTDSVLLMTPAEAFLSAFGMHNDRALALVKMLCRRLRDTTLRATHHMAAPGDAPHADPVIWLAPDHELLTTTYGVTTIAVQQLPFQVGNRYGGETLAIASNHALTIQAHGRPDLAAPHFEIQRRDGLIGIRDLGSAKGTIVNGLPLTRSSLDAFARLHAGGNQVIAGAADSPFRFRIQLMDTVSGPSRPA